MPHLIVTVSDQEPRRVELDGPLVVGRVAPADLVIDDAKVSRRHCRFSSSGAGWTVTDLGSSNGTRVGEKVVKAHVLRDGDRVSVGHTLLEFRADRPSTVQAPVRRSARERLASRRRR